MTSEEDLPTPLNNPEKSDSGKKVDDLWDLNSDPEAIAQIEKAPKLRNFKPVTPSGGAPSGPVFRPNPPSVQKAQLNEIPKEDAPEDFAESAPFQKTANDPTTPHSPEPSESSESSTQENESTEIKKSHTKLSLRPLEVGFISVALAVLIALLYFAYQYTQKIPISPYGIQVSNLPAKGKLIEIEEVNTFWREPITSGPNADRVKSDTKVTPVIRIKVSKNSKDAVLWVVFKNDKGEKVGDVKTHDIVNGQFKSNNQSQTDISSTEGFIHQAYFTQYQLKGPNDKFWKVEVYELPMSGGSPNFVYSQDIGIQFQEDKEKETL